MGKIEMPKAVYDYANYLVGEKKGHFQVYLKTADLWKVFQARDIVQAVDLGDFRLV